MDTKHRESAALATAGGRMTPPSSAIPTGSALRVLQIPPQVLESLAREGMLKGQPDLQATWLFLGGWLLFFIAMAGLFIAFASRMPLLLGAVIAAAFVGVIWFLLRQFRHVGEALFEIDAQGMRWGAPAAPKQVAWRELRRVGPEGGCNVWTQLELDDIGVKNLVFDHALSLADGKTIQLPLRLPLRLSLDVGRVFRFRNRDALMRTLLLRLATAPVPRLRFDAQVFIDAGVDPRTWEPMPAPRRWAWTSYVFLISLLLAAIFGWPGTWDMGWLFAAFPVALLVGVGAAAWFMHRRYPDLQGLAFEFETPFHPPS